MKKQSIYKGLNDSWLNEFSHRYACWAYNHRGWAKAKKANKRIAKKRERRRCRKEMEDEEGRKRKEERL